jgi:dihydroorotate dehydrogenase (NAD+) catalytic subunit
LPDCGRPIYDQSVTPKSDPLLLPRYDWRQTYRWNYERAPDVGFAGNPPETQGTWSFCGIKIASPIGIAAGPLLNGKWCLYYAHLGFDVVTYKTVRSGHRPCYPLPNLQPVRCGSLRGGETNLPAVADFQGSWAVSFGMPSQAPETWTADVAETRRQLPPEKLLSVSVVGTVQPGWTIERLAEDYAECARLAAEHGADTVEINLSCPNVDTCDGQLFQQPAASRVVCQRVRQAIGSKPLIVKIGHFRDHQGIAPLLAAIAPFINAVATTNSIAATVVDENGRPTFDGQQRGICGRAILDASVRQTEVIAAETSKERYPLTVIGIGGIFSADDVRRYLSAGAEAVQLASAVMIDPEIGLKIRRAL